MESFSTWSSAVNMAVVTLWVSTDACCFLASAAGESVAGRTSDGRRARPLELIVVLTETDLLPDHLLAAKLPPPVIPGVVHHSRFSLGVLDHGTAARRAGV